MPSAIWPASQSERSCSSRVTRLPLASVRAAAAGVVQQHQREHAVRLGLVGHQHGEHPRQADGFPCQPGLPRVPVALVEQEIEHVQDGRQALGQQVRGRHAERDARVRDLLLGPEQALAHGALGSRNARAISAVLMPARLRSVSATWASRFSDGWQQVNMSSRRSSGISLSRAYGGGSGCMAATSRSFAASADARRIRSMARCRAVVVSHASG